MNILTWLRSLGTPWLGSWKVGRAQTKLGGEDVQVRMSTPTGWFLPYLDERTGETAAHRRAYRLMLKDPTIKSALLEKVLAVSILDLAVNGESESKVDKAAAEFGRFSLSRVTNGDFALMGLAAIAEAVLLPGLIDGFSICEKVFAPVQHGKWKGKVALKSLKTKDPERDVGLQLDDYDNITGLVGAGFNAGQVYDTRGFVVWRHLSIFNTPGGMSDLRAAYRAYWLIDTAWKLRARHLEKFSSPMMKGTYASQDQRAPLEAALEAARAATWISVPDGAMVEAMDLAMRGTADFQSAIQDLRQDVYICITGAMLQALQGTTSDGRGSSEVHKRTADTRKWHISECLRAVCDLQLLPDLTDLNFVGASYPSTAFGGVSDQELVTSQSVDRGLYDMGVPLSKRDLQRRYNRPEPVDEADTIKQPEAAPGPGGLGFSDVGARGELVATPLIGASLNSQPARFRELPKDMLNLVRTYCDGKIKRKPAIALARMFYDLSDEVASTFFPEMESTGGGTEKTARDAAHRWGVNDPSPEEMDQIDRELEGSGWALVRGPERWEAIRVDELAGAA